MTLPLQTLRAFVAATFLASLAACPMSGSGGACQIDSDCSGSEVCARDEMCAASSTVRQVTASWTIRPMTGQFTVDKLPDRFRQVELGVEGGVRDLKTLSADGTATLDLRL